ncbi:MAG TPA: dihydrofolate reductase family protein [Chloroflexota bacterium]|nr:dihydrofolate reductase family protein [Chloroflexota bacterium]
MIRRPYVLINVAASVDGKIDSIERRGAAMSSERDRARVDALRASVDAVMVGGRTLLQEDPRLTVRSAELRAERAARGEPENPAKVGVVSRPDLRPDCRFLSVGPARILLFTCGSDSDWGWLRDRHVQVHTSGDSRVDLAWALDKLADLGIRRLLVEGGGTLNFELLRLGLVDEVRVFIAPLVLGGASAPTLADGAGLVRDQAIKLRPAEVEQWEDGGLLLRYMVDQT